MSFSHWTIATRINSKRRDKRSAFHNYKKRFDLKNITAYQKTSNVTKVPLEAIRTKIKKRAEKNIFTEIICSIHNNCSWCLYCNKTH
jgi:hypothetical protein